jgi:uncharacterized protein
MSVLRTKLSDDLKTAMKGGAGDTVATLRLIMAKLKDIDIEARGKGKDAATDTEIMSLLQGMIKQRMESAKIFRDNGRPELADKEDGEIKVITGYLPQQLSDDAALAEIGAIIAEIGAVGVKDMGKAMAAVKEKLAGRFDMSKASTLVKQTLAG